MRHIVLCFGPFPGGGGGFTHGFGEAACGGYCLRTRVWGRGQPQQTHQREESTARGFVPTEIRPYPVQGLGFQLSGGGGSIEPAGPTPPLPQKRLN